MSDRTGEREGDEEIFLELAAGLRRFAAVVRPPELEPDDLVQEALTRTLTRGSLTALDNPGAYLRTAIVRLASNATRSKRRERARLERMGAPDVARVDTYPSDVSDLMRVPIAARAVLYLSVIEGRPYRDISAIVGCSEANARTLAARALRELRAGDDVEEGAPT